MGTDRVKILISAYKDHQENLNNSKSSKGKKSVWEKIDTFTEHCKTAGIGSSISLTQIKEKWREKNKLMMQSDC